MTFSKTYNPSSTLALNFTKIWRVSLSEPAPCNLRVNVDVLLHINNTGPATDTCIIDAVRRMLTFISFLKWLLQK